MALHPGSLLKAFVRLVGDVREHQPEDRVHPSALDLGATTTTTTLKTSLGSFRAAPGLGVLVNNEVNDSTVKPGAGLLASSNLPHRRPPLSEDHAIQPRRATAIRRAAARDEHGRSRKNALQPRRIRVTTRNRMASELVQL